MCSPKFRACTPAETSRTAAIDRPSPLRGRVAWPPSKWRSISKKKGTKPATLNQQEQEPMPAQCTHLGEIRKVTPSGKGCKECLEMGDRWVHLRLCLSCGHVGCC